MFFSPISICSHPLFLLCSSLHASDLIIPPCFSLPVACGAWNDSTSTCVLWNSSRRHLSQVITNYVCVQYLEQGTASCFHPFTLPNLIIHWKYCQLHNTFVKESLKTQCKQDHSNREKHLFWQREVLGILMGPNHNWLLLGNLDRLKWLFLPAAQAGIIRWLTTQAQCPAKLRIS